MNQLGTAMRRAGYATPRERIERLMSEAIDSVERRMGSAIDEYALKRPSVGEFSRRLLADAGDVGLLIWELFAEHRETSLGALYERVRAEKVKEKFPAAARPALQAVAPQQPAAPEAAPAPCDEDQSRSDVHQTAVGVAAGQGAVAAVARRSLLKSFLINGSPLGDVTAGEARGWAKARARDARFIALVTEGLTDDVRIGKAIDDTVAAKAYALAEAADNE